MEVQRLFEVWHLLEEIRYTSEENSNSILLIETEIWRKCWCQRWRHHIIAFLSKGVLIYLFSIYWTLTFKIHFRHLEMRLGFQEECTLRFSKVSFLWRLYELVLDTNVSLRISGHKSRWILNISVAETRKFVWCT